MGGNSEVPSVMPRALTEAERERFLSEKHVGVLSVAASDGRPPASVPIWYDYTPGGNIRINTGASRRKTKLIERTRVVTLVVQREELPYQYVAVEGTVVDTTTPTPLEVREAIATRYLGEDGGREFVRRMGDYDSVLFTIRPDRWFTADFSVDE
jgi:PPOX class probable F420-dependent enzyme